MDEVEEIKRRIDIVDFISTYLTLKKAGSNYKAVCPFHQEKTPSLMVSAEKQIFKCFGCGEGGDIFSFVMKMENLEFPEALKILAERAGVQLKRREFKPEEGKDRKTRLYKLNNLSALAFNKILLERPAGKQALEYLEKRKITLQTLKDFMVGYAPSKMLMSQFLQKRGFNPSEIQSAGSPDRFFRRIIFPIRDVMGNVIAFTGRVLDPKQEPKYLNTPETIIFHKGQILYNLNQARGSVKQENAAVVVEGQMDVIASHQAGVKNVVATSGTALTNEHLRILYRYTPNIIFAFDSDTAGLVTSKKAYEMAISKGFNVRMVDLEEFKDPGEMIAVNPKLWTDAVTTAKPVIDWYFQLAFKKSKIEDRELTSQEKKEIAKEILPIIKIIPDSIEQAHFVNLLAKRLEVNEDVVFDALTKVSAAKQDNPKQAQIKKRNIDAEDLLLSIMLFSPDKIPETRGKIKLENFKNKNLATIYTSLEREYDKDKKNVLKRIKNTVSRETSILIDNLIAEAEKLYEENSDLINQDFAQAIAHMQKDTKEDLKEHYAQEIKKAENARDYKKLKQLVKEFQEAISK
ncbi:MAG: dnaG [Candidatus Berkelbacteria bacterium]|nr:dnaG [Candidatus Berkelbacteria bacterium]